MKNAKYVFKNVVKTFLQNSPCSISAAQSREFSNGKQWKEFSYELNYPCWIVTEMKWKLFIPFLGLFTCARLKNYLKLCY